MRIFGRFGFAAATAVFLLAISCGAYAGTDAARSSAEETITSAGYSLGIAAGYGFKAHGMRGGEIALALPSVAFPVTGVVGGRSFYRGVLEYKAEALLATLTNHNNRGIVGLSPVGLRYDFTSGGSLVPYAEGLLGALYLDTPRNLQPPGFNFMESGAVGFRYFRDRLAWDVQARFTHISNAGIWKPNRGMNEVILLLGLGYY